jgi:hypothetical protein
MMRKIAQIGMIRMTVQDRILTGKVVFLSLDAVFVSIHRVPVVLACKENSGRSFQNAQGLCWRLLPPYTSIHASPLVFVSS